MRKIKEVLRLHFDHQQSARQIAKSCSIARSIIKEYLDRAQKAGLNWPLPADLDDATLENILFPQIFHIPQEKRQMPPMDYLHRERKKKGVTLQLLWHEYKEANPDGYQYSQFCELYRKWVDMLDVCLRQEYRAGEKLFVDYAGQTIPLHDPLTGKIHEFFFVIGGTKITEAVKHASKTETLAYAPNHVEGAHIFSGLPGPDEWSPIRPSHDRFAVIHIGPAGNRNPQAIDFQPVKSLNARLNDLLIAPAHQPIGGCPIEKIMFAGAFPHKVPAMLRIDPNRTPAR